uniref:NADH dehydrogenase subunit 4L n=1 Tax=Pedicinus badii TaxID=430776 RepID=A0A7H1K1B2_9NEOP|nr:NADH dehydrogenase subunit 4L [Pedicinus badii]
MSFYFLSFLLCLISDFALASLISFEAMSCSLYFYMLNSVSFDSGFYFSSIFLLVAVCEGVLGLSIFTSMGFSPGKTGSMVRSCSKF